MDDEAVDVEVEVDLPEGAQDEEGVDAWRPDFPIPADLRETGRVIDSRRWLVLPERYVYRPLGALEAAKECDKLTSTPGGSHLVGLASELRVQRLGLLAQLREEYDEESAQTLADVAMVGHAEEGLERLLEALEGKRFMLTEWSLGWLKKCDVRRVPLPGSTDGGGRVIKESGPGGWPEFYKGRYVFLHRLAAAVAWETVGPFFCDVRTP